MTTAIIRQDSSDSSFHDKNDESQTDSGLLVDKGQFADDSDIEVLTSSCCSLKSVITNNFNKDLINNLTIDCLTSKC